MSGSKSTFERHASQVNVLSVYGCIVYIIYLFVACVMIVGVAVGGEGGGAIFVSPPRRWFSTVDRN